jgi:hypothetical protein
MSSRQASIPRQHTTCAHCALSGRPLIYKSGCQANRLRSSGRPLAAKVLDRNALSDLAGYSQLSVVPCCVNGFTPRVGRRW